jgi:hypothetical protein
MRRDNAGQRATAGSKAPQSKAFVIAGKTPLTSMNADSGVCAANLLSWLYLCTSLGSANDFKDLSENTQALSQRLSNE